ncbi:hypothetical protein AOCH_006154 [Aspergillus ochraceoroseus]|uniref:SLC26A/SulP transporter domain-containing protein n=1 Tax=Aspergillus ochraceoroseus TaxID=138278 RepID=A0A0F8UZA9_9EURO|nr:hypothetical protein AOCH_006154 [Aspergillus ochraceoroseus]
MPIAVLAKPLASSVTTPASAPTRVEAPAAYASSANRNTRSASPSSNMGVLGLRDRRDSQLSRHRPFSSDNVATDVIDALAEPSSPPRTLGSEPVVADGTSYRTPSRSFHHRSFINSSDPAHYSSHGVREQTAELASLALAREPRNLRTAMDVFQSAQSASNSVVSSSPDRHSTSSDGVEGLDRGLVAPPTGSSVLTAMIRDPESGLDRNRGRSTVKQNELSEPTASPGPSALGDAEQEDSGTERTPLISRSPRPEPPRNYGIARDVEGQMFTQKESSRALPRALSKISSSFRTLGHPKSWNGRAVWRHGIVYPASLLPSVFLGLLLNVLDALSYGMILFPLGESIFSDLGSDGISMYYVSTIISQLVFSCGGSIFRGGVGSEMIEVVPFFHQMAYTILNRVGADNPQAVIATTILSFSVSSILTGLVFFLMGTCKVGSLIGFFPRHILIGCIGGVGFFLILTGLEVSARLSGSFEFNLATLHTLFQLSTIALWTVPLVLAIGLLVLRRFIRSNYLVGAYFIAITVVFYIVKFSIHVSMDVLRNSGWVFAAPSSSHPWYHFYTLYGKFATHPYMDPD